MNDPAELIGWPEGSAFVLARVDATSIHHIVAAGDLDQIRAWASVTKLAVAFATLRAVDAGAVALTTPAGPPGATLAHLLAHASGLGLEASDPVRPVGTRRLYSNVGVDLAVHAVIADADPVAWLASEVFTPLAMTSSALTGRPAAGGRGSLRDLLTLATAWWRADGVEPATRDHFVTPFLADLAGVVPGFGRFEPCEWGLGPEIHGRKHHWMGSRLTPTSYGHFGQSGAYLVVEPESGVVVAAASGEPFGPWAVRLWPRWIDELYDRYVAA